MVEADLARFSVNGAAVYSSRIRISNPSFWQLPFPFRAAPDNLCSRPTNVLFLAAITHLVSDIQLADFMHTNK